MHDDDLTEVAEAAYGLLLKMLGDPDNAPDDDAFASTTEDYPAEVGALTEAGDDLVKRGLLEETDHLEISFELLPPQEGSLKPVQQRGARGRTPRRQLPCFGGAIPKAEHRPRRFRTPPSTGTGDTPAGS
jgi:hypothetical protein